MEYERIQQEDAEAFAILAEEDRRQADSLELIPSENYASRAVREAMASTLTNKYAEGYPGRRYYGGQAGSDAIELLALARAKKLFNAGFANVQPLGGANANIATYMALLEPGDTVLGMELSHGGHLTHGHPATYLAKMFRFVRYGMSDISTGAIDYDALAKTAEQERPKILLAGFSSYPRTLDWQRLADIAHSVGAIAVADVAHIAGLIAGGALENPLACGFDVMTTTTHKTLRGPRGGLILTNDAVLAKRIDQAVFPGLQGGPHMNLVAAKAVAFAEALHPSFATYAQAILDNARAMADVFASEGIPLVTGGTENHLLLLDTVQAFGISGAEAEHLLERAGLAVNKNILPNDTRSVLDPSGIRFGTPAMTTRGITQEECADIARMMIAVLQKRDDATIDNTKEKIRVLCATRPIPESFI